MSALVLDLATIGVLWRRDLRHFVGQPSRLVGALGQPIIVWLIIGSGMAATFSLPTVDIGYLEYFYPGVVMMVLLFASIFASISVIEDRRGGFLRVVMAGPGSRLALVLGKCFGSSSVALLQAMLFLALAPLAGFDFSAVDWPLFAATMVASALGLTALGFALAWLVGQIQAYHAIQMTVFVPTWIVSGAMFPPDESHPVFSIVMSFNPAAFAMSALRHALYGGAPPAGTTLTGSPWIHLAAIAGCGAAALLFAVAIASRRR